MNENLPPGAIYIENYISVSEQACLINQLDNQIWNTELKRRVQHFGFIYDYKTRKIDSSQKIGKVPQFLDLLGKRLKNDEYFKATPDQVIANEYLPGQGISRHVDCEPCFEDTIASISLLSTCEMIFRSRTGKMSSIILQPLSLLILSAEARYDWSHEIPARKSDIISNERIPRSRRVSLTFRNVIL